MKKYTYILITMLIAGSTASALAEAGDACSTCGRRGGGNRGADMFTRLDTDGDGQISVAEFEAGREAMRDKMEDRGGRKGGRRGSRMSPEKRQGILSAYDADGDGTLSEAERAEARKDWEAKRSTLTDSAEDSTVE